MCYIVLSFIVRQQYSVLVFFYSFRKVAGTSGLPLTHENSGFFEILESITVIQDILNSF